MIQNLHPMVVHFPIALLLVGFLFASLSIFCKKCNKMECSTDSTKPSCIQKTAYWLLALGALSAAAAVTTGFLFTNTPSVGPLVQLHNTHIMFAVSTMVVALIAAGIYTYYIYKAHTKQVLAIGYTLYVICAVLVAITGHFGGEMVYMFK